MAIKEIQKKIVPILKSAGVKRAGLFGSAVRGEMRGDSDVDILVELPRLFSLLDYIHLKHQIEDSLGRPVDLVEYDAIKPLIRDKILSSKVEIL